MPVDDMLGSVHVTEHMRPAHVRHVICAQATRVLLRRASTSTCRRTIYIGPLARTARTLKRFSLASFVLTSAAAPLLIALPIAASVPAHVKFGMAVGAVGASLVSTSAVFWLLGPYVTRISLLGAEEPAGKEYDAAEVGDTSEVLLESLSVFGTRRETPLRVGDLRPGSGVSMFASWQQRAGASRRRWFVHDGLVQTPEMAALVAAINAKAATHEP